MNVFLVGDIKESEPYTQWRAIKEGKVVKHDWINR